MASIIGANGPVLEPQNAETVVIDVVKEVEIKNEKEKIEIKTHEKNENEETNIKSEEENKVESKDKGTEQTETQNKNLEEELVREKEEEARAHQEREERERQAAALFGNPLSTDEITTDVSKNLVESAISSLIGGAPVVTTDANLSSSSSSSSVMPSFVQVAAVGDESGENVGEGITDEPLELNKPDDSLFEDGKDVGIDEDFISEMVGGVKKKRGKKGKKGKK
jgi:hypothetical protein